MKKKERGPSEGLHAECVKRYNFFFKITAICSVCLNLKGLEHGSSLPVKRTERHVTSGCIYWHIMGVVASQHFHLKEKYYKF